VVETPAVVEPCAVVESPGIVDERPVEGLKDVVAEPEVEEIMVELGDGLEVDCIAKFVVVVDTPGLEEAGEDSDSVGVLDGPAGNVDEEEVEGEDEDEEEEDEDGAGHSSLSVPVRGPAPMQ